MRTNLGYMILLILSINISCKKDKINDPPAVQSAPPCDASNLIVNSFNEQNGSQKFYKFTIFDYVSTSASTTSNVVGSYNLTITINGDTTINSLPGKTYKIVGNNSWDFKAYSYYNSNDSIWKLNSLSNTHKYYFDLAFKLPLLSNSSYSTSFGSNNQTFNIGTKNCINVNNQNYPVFQLSNAYLSGFPSSYYRRINVNSSGLISWDCISSNLDTQNSRTTGTIHLFELQ